MPHKHTRRKDDDRSTHNLPTISIAGPLPAFTKDLNPKKKQDAPRGQKRKRVLPANYKEDDTPRAFSRIMQFQDTRKRPSGLDDGNTRRSKKAKLADADEAPKPEQPAAHAEVPKIMPGESLADYAARVDRALPVGGLARKGKVALEGVKERQTKTEKRLQKMYATWRAEELKRKEKADEAQEREDEAEEEREAEFGAKGVGLQPGKRQRMVGETADDDEDPWAVLNERREKPRGLHDVVKAPPNFKTIPRERFKISNGAKVDVTNVPATAGSLKRREELGDTRRDVIERYRAMVKERGS